MKFAHILLYWPLVNGEGILHDSAPFVEVPGVAGNPRCFLDNDSEVRHAAKGLLSAVGFGHCSIVPRLWKRFSISKIDAERCGRGCCGCCGHCGWCGCRGCGFYDDEGEGDEDDEDDDDDDHDDDDDDDDAHAHAHAHGNAVVVIVIVVVSHWLYSIVMGEDHDHDDRDGDGILDYQSPAIHWITCQGTWPVEHCQLPKGGTGGRS